MFTDTKFNFIFKQSPFVSGTTAKMVKKLTLSEEKQLREISTRARSDMYDRYQIVNQQVSETKAHTDSDILAFHACSACGAYLRSIKKGILNRLLSRSVRSGLLCNNEECSFYLKFIPTNKATKLTNVAFIQQITFATENFLKEHPEYRRK